MNVLIVGSGAREHAIAWKLQQSPLLTDLFVAPGNAGTAAIAHNLELTVSDREGIIAAAKAKQIDLVAIGPEQPLAEGLADRLAAEGIAAFGPSQQGARIESSKAFAKGLMQSYGIPHARSAIFTSATEARAYINGLASPPVVKADGLAAGKGAFVCRTREEALHAIDLMMDEGVFGAAGATVVIEEKLDGREVSAHAFSDGVSVRSMPFACDYKRARDGDDGPNTGGMGAYSPPFWLDEALEPQIQQGITEATVRALAEEGVP